jgi:hypothetical protein
MSAALHLMAGLMQIYSGSHTHLIGNICRRWLRVFLTARQISLVGSRSHSGWSSGSFIDQPKTVAAFGRCYGPVLKLITGLGI